VVVGAGSGNEWTSSKLNATRASAWPFKENELAGARPFGTGDSVRSLSPRFARVSVYAAPFVGVTAMSCTSVLAMSVSWRSIQRFWSGSTVSAGCASALAASLGWRM
jgi:hypothetical protein